MEVDRRRDHLSAHFGVYLNIKKLNVDCVYMAVISQGFPLHLSRFLSMALDNISTCCSSSVFIPEMSLLNVPLTSIQYSFCPDLELQIFFYLILAM